MARPTGFSDPLIARFEETDRRLGPVFEGRYWFNVWPAQLATPDLRCSLAATLDRSSLSPRRIGIEISEQAPIRDDLRARRTLDSLRELGVAVAMDDFGVMNASIERLTSLPLDVVKLDQKLVQGIASSREHRLFSGAMVDICQGRNLALVAEGVERAEDLQVLSGLGIDMVQGYLLCPPLPVDELLPILAAWDQSRVVKLSNAIPAQPPRVASEGDESGT